MYAIIFRHRANPRLTVISPPWFTKEREAVTIAEGMRKIHPKGQHQAVKILKDSDKDSNNDSENLPV